MIKITAHHLDLQLGIYSFKVTTMIIITIIIMVADDFGKCKQ